MIAPVRYLHPTEVKVLKARLRGGGEAKLIARLVGAGWPRDKALLIIDVLKRDTEVRE